MRFSLEAASWERDFSCEFTSHESHIKRAVTVVLNLYRRPREKWHKRDCVGHLWPEFYFYEMRFSAQTALPSIRNDHCRIDRRSNWGHTEPGSYVYDILFAFIRFKDALHVTICDHIPIVADTMSATTFRTFLYLSYLRSALPSAGKCK